MAALGYSLPLLLGGCTTIAHAPARTLSELTLDGANPVIDATIEGVPMRLRVALDAHDTIELNPAAAKRLALRYAGGVDIYVGRILLVGHAAIAKVRIGSVEGPLQVTEHGRPCCASVDGTIGPQLLPYGRVTWRNRAAPPPTGTIMLVLADEPATGLSAAAAAPGVRVRFALDQAQSGATAAAGAILAQLWNGRWDGPEQHVPAAFGILRPARAIAFENPSTLAGFRFDRLMVRTADFGGGEKLPLDRAAPDEIVVRRTLPRQEAWPAVTLGADRLDLCVEIAFDAEPRRLTLRCAFD